MKRNGRLELQLLILAQALRHFLDVVEVVDFEKLSGVIGNAQAADVHGAELSRDAEEIGPLDVRVEFVVVALSTVEALAKERSRRPRGEHVLVDVAFARRDRDEV